MKILVTGGAGFIGSHTVDALLKKGYEVRILDNLQKPVHIKGKPKWLAGEAEFLLGDVRDKDMWRKALEGVDAVFHMAAYQDYLPDFSTFFHVNSVGTALLYEVIVEKKLDIKKIVIASSQFVQGEGIYRCSKCNTFYSPTMRDEKDLKKGIWDYYCPKCKTKLDWQWTPETHASPPNAYAMSKYSQELQAIVFGKRYGIPSVALRYSIVQGPRQSFYNAYSGACRIFCISYFFDKAPTIFEDGQQCRDFVNIHDVVDANIMALEDDRMLYEVYNVGGGRAWKIIEFANIVKREFEKRKGYELPDPIIPGLYRVGDTRNACSDISKLKALGWRPKFSPEDSVREYVDWLYEEGEVENLTDYAAERMTQLGVLKRIEK